MYKLQEAKNDYSTLAEEYQSLSRLKTLNFQQAERLSYIVDSAIDAPELDRLIQNVDLLLLSEQDKHEILNQQAKMREYLIINYRGILTTPHSAMDNQLEGSSRNR